MIELRVRDGCQKRVQRRTVAGVLGALLVLCCGLRTAGGADVPFARLFDAGSASWPAAGPSDAWEQVPEGQLQHDFAGDAVLMNDRVAVRLSRGAEPVRVYSVALSRWRRRASVGPIPQFAAGPARLASVSIIENTPAAVEVGASFVAPGGGKMLATFRVTTGESVVELRAGAGTAKFSVWLDAEYVVIPDYFGDDMAFGPHGGARDGLLLPAENYLLGLLRGGDAMLMCVWPSADQDAVLRVRQEGGEQRIAGCEMTARRGQKLWLALLEHEGIWHARRLSPAERGRQVRLDWQPPFPARWRCDLVRADGTAASWTLADGDGSEREASGAMGATPACRLNGAAVRCDVPPASEEEASAIVIYPIDRAEATPLTLFCPIDITRGTLGMGACQYILAIEGLGGEGNPTPAVVTEWVERQFARNRAGRMAARIKSQLDAMVDNMARTEDRIEAYEALARDVLARCGKPGAAGEGTEAASELRRIAGEMLRAVASRREAVAGPDEARRLADGIAALIGQPDAIEECRRLGERLRAIGAAQDATLARCRMGARRLRQCCRMAAAGRKEMPRWCRAVLARVESVLRRQQAAP